jgi:hypothetical protein
MVHICEAKVQGLNQRKEPPTTSTFTILRGTVDSSKGPYISKWLQQGTLNIPTAKTRYFYLLILQVLWSWVKCLQCPGSSDLVGTALGKHVMRANTKGASSF